MNENKLDQTKLEEFRQATVTIGKTTFRFTPVPVIEAFDILEDIRFELGQTVSQNASDMTFEYLISVFFALPKSFVSNIRQRMFKFVHFKNDQSTGMLIEQNGLSNVGVAFTDLTPFDIYEVFTRSLVVTFFLSFKKLMLRFQKHPTE